MEKKDFQNWLPVFMANYEGISKEAKSLEPFLKTTYKGDVYIPWAVMERLTYQCDPEAVFSPLYNNNGGLVHTDVIVNHQQNIQKGEIISETTAPMFSHFVRVALTFLGKTFIEEYPIQDKDYGAAKIYDQNLVNKALQRAKAKVASRATGLGLKLYEGFDLQFDTKEEDKKPELTEVKKETKKTTKKVEETQPVQVEETKPVELEVTKTEVKGEVKPITADIPLDSDISEILHLIRETADDKITAVLQKINPSIIKKYNFAIATKDTDEELIAKISQFPEPGKFKNSLLNLIK